MHVPYPIVSITMIGSFRIRTEGELIASGTREGGPRKPRI